MLMATFAWRQFCDISGKTIAFSDTFCSITNFITRTNFREISFFYSNKIYFRPIIVLLLAALAFYPVISFSSVTFSDRKLPVAIYLFNTFTLSTEFIFGEKPCPLSNDINPLQKFLSRWKVFTRDAWKKNNKRLLCDFGAMSLRVRFVKQYLLDSSITA